MPNLVIVAIPNEESPVWSISSEKIPHVTLLYLGESNKVQNREMIVEFLGHAARTSLTRFSLDVDRRGKLGDDDADVLFFYQGWEFPKLKEFRGYLLQDPNISKAYLAAEQFPMWQPHLTLGYPDKPAAKPENSSDRVSWVDFDRVALWDGTYNGSEFYLKSPSYESPPEVSMSITLDEVLSHHGVKGMRWGRRKSDNSPTEVVVTRTPKGKVKTAGGKNQPAHSDAVVARIAAQKAKKSGLDSLSNEELQRLARRLELEQKVSNIGEDRITGDGRKFVQTMFELSTR